MDIIEKDGIPSTKKDDNTKIQKKEKEKIKKEQETVKKNLYLLNNINNTYNSIPKYKKSKFAKILSFGTKTDILFFIIGIVFSILQGATLPAFSLAFGKLIGSFTEPNIELLRQSLNQNSLLMLYFGIIIFFTCMIGYLSFGYSGRNMTENMKIIYFKELLEKDSNYLDSIEISKLNSNFIENVNDFENGFSEKLNLLFFSLGMLISGVVIGFYIGWLVTILILVTTPLLIIGMKIFLVYLEKSNKLTKDSYIESGSITEESLSLIKSVKSNLAEEHVIKKFSHSLVKHEKISKKYTWIIGSLYGFFFFLILSMYAIGFLIGTIVISRGIVNDNSGLQYTAEDIIIIFFSVLTGGFALGQVGPSFKTFNSGINAFNNIDKFLSIESNINISSNKGLKPEKLKGEIEFRNVSFSYPSKKDLLVLKNVSFKISEGESIAFIGESGSGKSTIIQLIERFYDVNEGEILIDGINIKDYNIYHLRNLIGLVSQDPFLFGSSIRNNLKLSLPDDIDLNDQEYISGLSKANASKFVSDLTKGLDTFVGAGGSQFSGGQKQRISLTRAILRNPKILLLDEATSALDRKNEVEIQATLNEISKNRTSINIAHRLRTIENSDRIYVLKNGEIIEFGNHNELLDLKKEYYKLQQIQGIKEKFKEKKKENNNDDNEINKNIDEKINLNIIDNENNKENEIKSKDKEKLITINDFIGDEKKLIPFGIIGSIFNGSIMPLFGFIFADIIVDLVRLEIYHRFPNSGFNIDELNNNSYLTIGYMFIIAFGAFIFNFFSLTIYSYIGEVYSSKLRTNYFKCLIYKDIEFFDKETNKPGALNQQLSTDCKDINLLISTYSGVIIQSLSTMVVGLIIAFISSWRLTLVNWALIPLMMIGGAADAEMQNTSVSNNKNDKIEGASILNETLNNIKIVWSLSSHKKFITIFLKSIEESKKTKVLKSVKIAVFYGFSQFSMFAVYAILFYVGGIFIQDYNERYEDINRAIFSLIFAGYGAGAANQFIANIGNANRAKKVIEEELNKKNNLEKNPLLIKHKILKNEDKLKINKFQDKIEFKNVYFKYPSRNEMVLKDISFIINHGEKIAFVGHSGCGKSTIIQLLLRFYEIQSGEILIDGINIKDIEIDSLRSIFGIVSQDTTLFNGNIEYNIEYNNSYNEKDIIDATKKALAYDFIIEKNDIEEKDENNLDDNNNKKNKKIKAIKENNIIMKDLPKGFYFNVGNKGEKLSGGQRQRICISRCLIRDPAIYLFDEATSALDNQSEKIIQEAIDKISQENTSILIAHRISTIKNSNKLFVLDHGYLVEHGTYDELMEKEGIFFTLNN